ncbi:MAG: methyltransferase domain-containing protein [Mariprofundaceae bacterium]
MNMDVCCPLCGISGPHRVVEDNEPPYQVLVCPACDYGFVHPLPDQERLAAAYQEAYYEPWRSKHVVARRRMWRWRLKQVRMMVPAGRLLEVGAGDGDFLSLAVEAGYEVAATEFSEAAAASIRDRVPEAMVWKGEVEELGLPESEFDVVVAWHSLEHMRFPFRALAAMRRTLKPGAALFIAVPNRNNHLMRFFYRLVRGRPYPLFSLRGKEIHLSHFTPRSLKRAVEDAGFEVRGISPDHAMVEPAKRLIDSLAVLPFIMGGHIGTEAMLLTAVRKENGS